GGDRLGQRLDRRRAAAGAGRAAGQERLRAVPALTGPSGRREVKVVQADLPGCPVLEPRGFGDERGYFSERWNPPRFADHGLPTSFVQGNVSRSARGVLRGLHFQWPDNPQGKLVSVLEGEVYDVAVDVRRGSPTFGRWTAVVLSADNKRHFWIPAGFAHGLQALSEHAVFTYRCTAPYAPPAETGVRWDDPRLAIDWPVKAPSLSPKDAAAPLLDEVPAGRLPTHEPQ